MGSLIVVVGDNADVATSVPPRGLDGSVTLRTTISPPDVAASMVRVTDDTVAFFCSFTTIVTAVSSRNWFMSNQRELHDVDGLASIMLMARSGWSPSSLFHDRTWTEEITGVTVASGGGVVVRLGAGSSSDCCVEVPARSDWVRSRSVTGRVAIHGPQIAPIRNRTTPKMSAGRVGSMSCDAPVEGAWCGCGEAAAAAPAAAAPGAGATGVMTSVGPSLGGAGMGASRSGRTRGIWWVEGASSRGVG